MVSNVKIASLLLMIVLIDLGQAAFSRVPPPPRRPDHLLSREDLKRYLQKVHEYHSILGRWRLRREFDNNLSSHTFNDDIIKNIDNNHDDVKTTINLLKN
ncbi:unnamed protein product [Rotaria sp. Silwood1]|nr:unnamed protein product [Rotaria sp. Silwood1]CAF1534411.1 unnamed protein product [Rotaria sp. Silwood1]CAF1541161.1 unnamed protein product [Rotaria sp. Silwood1]CAF3678987.1 unnamed protein product [Rotaria sp. Silwood1]CAF4810297.1 unnamed protein product [Rotaria sp. Silwood1]